MNESLDLLARKMREAGVIPPDATSPARADNDRPWYLALVQGFAGWLAGVFLLVFVGAVFRPDDRVVIFLLGAALLAAAWFIYRADRDAVFLDQFALAISIAGQFAVAWSAIDRDFEGLPVAFTVLVLQLALWVSMPNKLARVLAAFFATIAWVYVVRFTLQPGEGEEVLFGANVENLRPAWILALGWPLTWLPLVALAAWLLWREPRWMATRFRELARPALTGLLLGLAVSGIAAEPFSVFALGMGRLGLELSGWSVFGLLNIGLALFAAYAAFRLRNGGLLGIAILGALLHLSRFYYLYGATLIAKSVIMLCVGAALLAAGEWLHRRWLRESP